MQATAETFHAQHGRKYAHHPGRSRLRWPGGGGGADRDPSGLRGGYAEEAPFLHFFSRGRWEGGEDISSRAEFDQGGGQSLTRDPPTSQPAQCRAFFQKGLCKDDLEKAPFGKGAPKQPPTQPGRRREADLISPQRLRSTRGASSAAEEGQDRTGASRSLLQGDSLRRNCPGRRRPPTRKSFPPGLAKLRGCLTFRVSLCPQPLGGISA